MAEPSDVVHEQPTSKVRDALDQILHFWPLLAVVFGGLAVIASTLGEVYVSGIAEETYVDMKTADPVINSIKSDITVIKGQLSEQASNDVEIRTQLGTIESRLDTLIRIQLENQ